MNTTLVIVDDDAGFRAAARRLLEAGGFRVVGEAGDVASTGPVVARLRPQAVLVDVQLPDGDGFAVAERLATWAGHLQVVLVSGRDRGDFGTRVRDCGARGFIDKAELSAGALQALLDGPR